MFRKIAPYLIFAVILIICCLVYYQKELFLYPALIHAWAQSDRLALAVSFFDNGMNIFKPATLSQFSKDGIVGVEFPIQAYLTAAIAKIFGRDHISLIFRLLDTIICCTGLFFLFAAAYKRTRDFFFALLSPLFIFSSPVYIYYACNYLPDAVSASIIFIGFYFLLEYADRFRPKDFAWAVAFLTLAAIIKISSSGYVAGFILWVFIRQFPLKGKFFNRERIALIIPSVLAIVVILFNYMHIQGLNETYHSWLFISKPRPFESWDDFKAFTDIGFKVNWINDYLVPQQYVVFPLVFLTAWYLSYAHPALRNRRQLLLFFLAFALMFFYLLGKSYVVHDYYVIAVFFPMFAFALIFSVEVLKTETLWKRATIVMRIALSTVIIISFFFADFYHNQRMRPDNPLHSSYYRTFWMEGAAAVANAAGIDKNEKIVVLDEEAPNQALIYFDRKGVVLTPEMWNGDLNFVLKEMKRLHTPWLAIEEANRDKRLQNNPDLFKHFDEVYTGNHLILYKLKASTN